MRDLYLQILSKVKTEERTETLMLLVDLLYDNNYTGLDYIMTIIATSEDNRSAAEAVEGIICRSAQHLLQRLSIAVSSEDINRYPEHIARLLKVILNDTSDYCDVDSMLAIFEDDESPDIAKLVSIVDLITDTNNDRLYDLISFIESRLINSIHGLLISRSISTSDTTTTPPIIIQRVVKFLALYPDSILAPVFANYGFMLPRKDIINQIDLGEVTDIDKFIRLLVVTVVGITICTDETREDISTVVEDTLQLLIPPVLEPQMMRILPMIDKMIKEVTYE